MEPVTVTSLAAAEHRGIMGRRAARKHQLASEYYEETIASAKILAILDFIGKDERLLTFEEEVTDDLKRELYKSQSRIVVLKDALAAEFSFQPHDFPVVELEVRMLNKNDSFNPNNGDF